MTTFRDKLEILSYDNGDAKEENKFIFYPWIKQLSGSVQYTERSKTLLN